MDTGRQQRIDKKGGKKGKTEMLNMYPIVSSFSGNFADYIKQMNYRQVSVMTFQ